MRTTAFAHPNIALVKYWGKADPQRNIPAVGSISITLDTLTTKTSLEFDPGLDGDRFSLNGQPDAKGLDRVRHCLELFRRRGAEIPHACVESENNFPTAAGLASSASGFAALVVAVDRVAGTNLDRVELADMARQCSGSAARSLFGGYVELELASGGERTETRTLLQAGQWPLEVVIAVTAIGPKAVGSTEGMALTERTSPYYRSWVETSETDLKDARAAIAALDFEALAEVSELSCLKMHAVALAARPGLLYWNGTTVDCIHQIRELRGRGTPVFFTVDAGPQVKAICEPGATDRVRHALGQIPGVVELLSCGLGEGAAAVGP